MKRVAIVYRSLPHYRAAFYEQLRVALRSYQIELELYYGEAVDDDALKRDSVTLDWAVPIPNRSIRLFGRTLLWQSCLRRLRGADLVIVEQASKLLVNYPLLVLQRLTGTRVALWGHGRNLQGHDASRIGEWVKRRVSLWPHWWFAYTEGTAAIVGELGFPRDRVTVVQNSLDTKELREGRSGLSQHQILQLRRELGLHGRHVAIFCGSLYREKRLDFLLEAAEGIRRELPDFELIVAGAGSHSALIEEASKEHTWIHYVGPQLGTDRVPYFAVSSLCLLPGLVGLAVVDSFVLEVPLVTVDLPFHSPEIDYLEHGRNGLCLPSGCTPSEYASAVVATLADERQLEQLREGCRRSAEVYTLDAMVSRFAEGVHKAVFTA